MLITSRTFSTTHIWLWSRERSEHMLHVSSSEIILHTLQYFASSRRLFSASVKWCTFSEGCLRRCRAKRSALLRPTPGREPMASTASVSSLDGYFSPYGSIVTSFQIISSKSAGRVAVASDPRLGSSTTTLLEFFPFCFRSTPSIPENSPPIILTLVPGLISISPGA